MCNKTWKWSYDFTTRISLITKDSWGSRETIRNSFWQEHLINMPLDKNIYYAVSNVNFCLCETNVNIQRNDDELTRWYCVITNQTEVLMKGIRIYQTVLTLLFQYKCDHFSYILSLYGVISVTFKVWWLNVTIYLLW